MWLGVIRGRTAKYEFREEWRKIGLGQIIVELEIHDTDLGFYTKLDRKPLNSSKHRCDIAWLTFLKDHSIMLTLKGNRGGSSKTS